MRRFKQLHVPDRWQHYWSKYPEGYTILEALIGWVDNVNKLTEGVNDWDEYLKGFVASYDKNLKETVGAVMEEWSQNGFIKEIINEYTNERIDDVELNINTLNQNKVDRTGSGQVSWSNLAQDAREKVTGGAVAIVGDNAVITSNITDSAVTQSKTTFSEKNSDTLNIFDRSEILSGYTLSRENGELISVATNTFTSGKIPVTGGLTYALYYDNSPITELFSVEYDAAGNIIAFGPTVNNRKQLNINTRYIRLTASGGTQNHIVVTPGHITNGPYVPFEPVTVIDDLQLQEGQVTAASTDFLTRTSPNLFDKTKVFPGYRVYEDGTTERDSQNSYITMLPVKPETTYSVTEGNYTVQLDSAGNYVTGHTTGIKTFTTLGNTRYLAMSVRNVKLDDFMLVEGSVVPTEYVPYGRYAFNSNVDIMNLVDDSDIHWLALGDSITEGSNEYPTYANKQLGYTLENQGHGGTTVALREGVNATFNPHSLVTLSETIDFSRHDIVTISFGTNDWSNSVALGSSDTLDEYTFNGALNKSISNIYSSNPKIRIHFTTPPYRANGKDSRNTKGLLLADYCEAIRDISKDLNVKVIDFYKECGWNDKNINAYSGDGLHPNSLGAAVLGGITKRELIVYSGLGVF